MTLVIAENEEIVDFILILLNFCSFVFFFLLKNSLLGSWVWMRVDFEKCDHLKYFGWKLLHSLGLRDLCFADCVKSSDGYVIKHQQKNIIYGSVP